MINDYCALQPLATLMDDDVINGVRGVQRLMMIDDEGGRGPKCLKI
jgi:hypothetical protein